MLCQPSLGARARTNECGFPDRGYRAQFGPRASLSELPRPGVFLLILSPRAGH